MSPKAFQLGLCIEHPQIQINQQKYGRRDYLDVLGAADYSLACSGERDVFTFCMCAGGYVIPSVSEPEMFCTNGMSNSRHDTPFANSGLVVTLGTEEFGSCPPAGRNGIAHENLNRQPFAWREATTTVRFNAPEILRPAVVPILCRGCLRPFNGASGPSIWSRSSPGRWSTRCDGACR